MTTASILVFGAIRWIFQEFSSDHSLNEESQSVPESKEHTSQSRAGEYPLAESLRREVIVVPPMIARGRHAQPYHSQPVEYRMTVPLA